MPGFRGYQNSLQTSELDELLPVVYDQAAPKGHGSSLAARFALTEAGRRSLLTRLEADDNENERVWNGLPGFQWHAAAQRAKIGSQVLATHDSDSTSFGRIPLIVTRTSPHRQSVVHGHRWRQRRWRKGVEDLYHYRFWGQVVRWMAYQRNMSQGESMRLFYSPDQPGSGQRVNAECQRHERSRRSPPNRYCGRADGITFRSDGFPSDSPCRRRLLGPFHGIFCAD